MIRRPSGQRLGQPEEVTELLTDFEASYFGPEEKRTRIKGISELVEVVGSLVLCRK